MRMRVLRVKKYFFTFLETYDILKLRYYILFVVSILKKFPENFVKNVIDRQTNVLYY